LIQATGFTKRYGRLTALQDVSFSIGDEEILGLIGPNGSGKTTLFECLGGVLPLDRGQLMWDGRRLSARDRASLFFYLPDAIAPWPLQSLRWALDFMRAFYGVRQRGRYQTPSRADVVERLDLGPILDSRIGTLSKGQRKRALLAIGLLMPHPILLADEPFDGLDLRQARELAVTLRSHAAAGRTLFLSIHQIGDAARVCDRFVLLSEGRVRGEGTLPALAALAGRRGTPSESDLEEVFLALT
jgi:ABC-2 type transport system ATP-binding protein